MNKVNKNVYIGAVLLLSILLYIACADDDIISFGQTSGPAYLSIPEAQEFFENSFTTAQTRNVADKKDNGKFDPGEFTPQWSKAVTSQNANMGSVDIPLLPEYKYKAIRCHFENGKSRAYMVDITQKLVVLKSKHTGKKVQYILSLIPEKDYYKKHKGDMDAAFTHAGEKNGYSGLAVYTHIGTSRIISVAKFRNGKLLANVFLPSGKGTLESRRKRANALLDGIKVPRIKATVTRSVGEGEPEVFYCSFCGQKVDNCECWSVEAECQCGVCALCLGRLCPWCDQDPCVCDLYCPFCEYLDCICDEPTGCVYCGEPDCHGECWDEGELPPIEENPDSKITAQDLFRNSNMIDENWQVIDKMLDKITENCMGEALIDGLYKALDGATLSIQFTNNEGGEFHFDGETAGISLGMSSVESNVLFHEMWHAYQAYQETESTFTDSMLNQEIEAHYAQYLYVSSLPEYAGNKWENAYTTDNRLRGTAKIKDYIDNKGSLINSTISALFETFMEFTLVPIFHKTKGYENCSYDNSRSITTNFSNLKELTKNC